MTVSSGSLPIPHLGTTLGRSARTIDINACLLCQARRIKCDQAKPECLCCQRIHISCPGYPQAAKPSPPRHSRHRSIDKEVCKPARKRHDGACGWSRDSVSFYLYADKTIKKWDTYASSLLTMPVVPSLLEDSSFTFIVPTPNGAIPAKIDIPVEEQAERYFLEHYVTVPSHPGDRGSNSFVPRFLKLPEDGQMQCFTSAFKAASLAALATRPSARSLRARAQLEYVKAIRAVGDAVQGLSKGVGSSKQTLGSILLLSLYETLACPSQQLGAFEAHVKGAVQLIMLLGMDELHSHDSREMVILARGRLLMLKVLPGYETAHTNALSNSLISVSYRDSLGRLGVWLASLCWRRDEIVKIIESGRRGPDEIARMKRLKDEANDVAHKFFQAGQDIQHGYCLEEIFAKYGPLFQALIHRADSPSTPSPPSESPSAPAGDGVDSADAASTPSEAASSDGSVIEVERDEFRPMAFRDHREASFYLSSMVASLVIQNTVIRSLAWLHMDEQSDPTAYERTPEYREAAMFASRSTTAIVNSVSYYRRSLLQNDSYSPGSVAPYFNVISMLSSFYGALVSQFATDAQKKILREELEVMANEGGIAQISALLGNQSYVVPRDDIERDRQRFRSPWRNSNFCTDGIMQDHWN